MTVSVELLLNVALILALAFLVVTWIWKSESNNSFGARVAKLLTETALVSIEVGLLTVNCLTGESYGFNLFLVFLWLLNMVMSALSMRND